MYVIIQPRDEVTVEFDASAGPLMPSGWTCDYLLFSGGWIKDSDINAAFSRR